MNRVETTGADKEAGMETERFVGLQDVGGGKMCAILQRKHYGSDGKNTILFDENSLRLRIANFKKDGYPTDQSEAALRAFEARGDA